jgi:hypothetical protein
MGAEGFEPLRILAGLEAGGVRCIVVGGLAAIAHGSDVATDDVDVCVEGTDDNLERLGLVLQRLAAEPRESDDEHRATFTTVAGQLDVIELDDLRYAALDRSASTIDVGRGTRARVASLDELADLKRVSGDLTGSVRMVALTQDTPAAPLIASVGSVSVRVDEFDELSRPDDPPTRARDKVWKALEDVDRFLTKLVDR